MDYFEAQATHALIVGVSDYRDNGLPDLPSANRNAARIFELLTSDLIGIPKNQVSLKTDPEDPRYILKRISKTYRKDGIRNFIFYYAGHGIIDDQHEFYLSLATSTLDGISMDGLGVARIRNCFDISNVRVILILDCCFAERAFDYFDLRNQLIIASTSKTELAIFEGDRSHSAFTDEFVRAISEGIPTAYETINLREIFEFVKAELSKKELPEPKKYDRNGVDALRFARNSFFIKKKVVVSEQKEDFVRSGVFGKYLNQVQLNFEHWKRKFVDIEAEEENLDFNSYVTEIDWRHDDGSVDESEDDLEEDDVDLEAFGSNESNEPEDDFPLEPKRKGNITDLIGEIPRMVIVGDPGIGKTTTLKYLAYLDSVSNLIVPVFIELKHFSDGESLLEIIAKTLNVSSVDLQDYFRQPFFRVYLDGLNEIINERLGLSLRTEIRRMLLEFPGLPVIISSRPLHYANEFQIPVFHLQLMDEIRIKNFILKNYDSKSQGIDFFNLLRSNPPLYRLGRNPLILTILIAVLKKNGGNFPENKGQLLRDFFRTDGIVSGILTREKAEKRPFLRDQLIVRLLSFLAFDSRMEGFVAFSRNKALSILKLHAKDFAIDYDLIKFLEEMVDLNFLVESDGGKLSFSHEMFQEYFAAEQISFLYEESPNRISHLWIDPNWKEPLTIFSGIAENRSRVMRDALSYDLLLAASCAYSTINLDKIVVEEITNAALSLIDSNSGNDAEIARGLMALSLLNRFDLIFEILGKTDTSSSLMSKMVNVVFETDDEKMIDRLMQLFLKLRNMDFVFKVLEILARDAAGSNRYRLQSLEAVTHFYIISESYLARKAYFRGLRLLVCELRVGIEKYLGGKIMEFIGKLVSSRLPENIELALFLIKRNDLFLDFPVEKLLIGLFGSSRPSGKLRKRKRKRR